MSSRSAQEWVGRLNAYLDGECDPMENEAIEQLVEVDVTAREQLEDLRVIRTLLEGPVAELEGSSVLPGLRRAISEHTSKPRASSVAARWLLVTSAMAASLAFFVSSRSEQADFRAKSAQPAVTDAERWAGIRVYRAVSDQDVERVVGTLGASDRLLFSYTNLGARPFEYLMIFAVDAASRVHFYYPARESHGPAAQSIAIERHVDQALADLITADLAPGPLVVYALFSRRALQVSEVERALSARRGLDSAQLGELSLHRLQLEVLR